MNQDYVSLWWITAGPGGHDEPLMGLYEAGDGINTGWVVPEQLIDLLIMIIWELLLEGFTFFIEFKVRLEQFTASSGVCGGLLSSVGTAGRLKAV